MKIKFLRARTAIIAGILCVVTTVTVVAATNGAFLVSRSNKNNAIKSFPSTDIVKSAVNFLPKYVENLNGGFKFYEFNYIENSLKNDDGNTVAKPKSAYFAYKRDGAKKNRNLNMYVDLIDKSEFDNMIEKIKDRTEYNDTKIYYHSIKCKDVPEDYKQTEEDLKLINEGRLEMAFGSDEIEEYNSQSVEWYENGIEYNIINNSYDDVDRDAMIQMAKTVINK